MLILLPPPLLCITHASSQPPCRYFCSSDPHADLLLRLPFISQLTDNATMRIQIALIRLLGLHLQESHRMGCWDEHLDARQDEKELRQAVRRARNERHISHATRQYRGRNGKSRLSWHGRTTLRDAGTTANWKNGKCWFLCQVHHTAPGTTANYGWLVWGTMGERINWDN